MRFSFLFRKSKAPVIAPTSNMHVQIHTIYTTPLTCTNKYYLVLIIAFTSSETSMFRQFTCNENAVENRLCAQDLDLIFDIRIREQSKSLCCAHHTLSPVSLVDGFRA